MLEIVANGFKAAKAALSGQAIITEANIEQAVRDIRVALLEADVEVGVVKTFLDRVKARAVGEVVELEVNKDGKKHSATPAEHFVLICQNELERLMGPVEKEPIVFRRPYTIIMMVGLQGTGKTTTCAKLANYLINDGRRPLLVAADIYRPAAVEQLQQLGRRLGVPVYEAAGLDPVQLCQDALREAKRKKRDVVIFDTAGRLAIDDEMMRELEAIKERSKPDNIFLVCDAMAGQDTVRTAAEFNRRLGISGFVMTKLDGDARGGAALSIKEITGKPVKFLGTGEGVGALEPFRPEGLASRILGMGDIVGLMQNFESVVDDKEAERDTRKLLRGEFTLDDFLKQLKMLQKVGSVREIYEKFPIFGEAGPPQGGQVDDKAFAAMESLIQSMTPSERARPQLIDESRATRIAKGAGRKPEQVRDLVGRFNMMQQMMAQLVSQPSLLGNLPGFKQLAQIRHLKGKGMEDVYGAASPGDAIRAMTRGQPMMPAGLGRAAAGMPMPGLPTGAGLPGIPGMAGAPLGMPGLASIPAGLPPGMAYADYAAATQGAAAARGPQMRQRSQKERDKAKQKRKAEKAARKKARRR